MRYNITHQTRYQYSSDVSLSHHIACLRPRESYAGWRHEGEKVGKRESEKLKCHRFELAVLPQPAVITESTDYFGNTKLFISVDGAHNELSITASSEVEIAPVWTPAPEETPIWERVRDLFATSAGNDVSEAIEFTFNSPFIKRLPIFAEYAAESFTKERTILSAVLDLSRRIHTDFKFDPRATDAGTPIEEFYRLRRGVCQDFAQFTIACLRSLGLPARYVSGYLETVPPPGRPRLIGADASHAWVSFFCPGHGWIDVDPTNNLLPSDRHVTVAWGREFNEVSPVRGVILGTGRHTLTVAVDVVPVETPSELAISQ